MKLPQVIAALWFLQSRSFINSTRQRLRRLKSPRYLIGAVIGVGYLWTTFFQHWMWGPGAAGVQTSGFTGESREVLEMAAALGVSILMALSWIFAGDRAALHFTEAEMAFLIPAPMSRTALIQYRLLRTQVTILFSGFVFGLISGRLLSSAGLFHLVAWWVVFSTVSMHGLAASFAVERLTTRGLAGWRRRLLFALVLLGGMALLAAWILAVVKRSSTGSAWNLFEPSNVGDSGRGFVSPVLLTRFYEAMASGPAPWIFAPARWLVRPWLARGSVEFLMSLGPALLFMVLHYLWVIRSAVAFEEASLAVSRTLNERIAAARTGQWQNTIKAKVRRDPFPLASVGFPPVAIFWKNLIGAGNLMTRRFLVFALWMLVVFAITLRGVSFAGGILPVAVVTAAALIPMSLFLGPQVLRNDFRSETRHFDVLKSLPLPEWQIIVGELLAPWVLLTVFQWLLMLFVGLMIGGLGDGPIKGLGPWIYPGLLSLAVVLPGLNAIQILIPNAWVIVFPGWSSPDPNRGGGFENLGQQMLFIMASILVLTVGLLPAGLIGGLVGFVGHSMTGSPWASLPAALIALAVLCGEFAIAVVALAPLLRRLDVTEA